MDCPACGETALVVTLPDDLREYLPSDPALVAVCQRCLTATPVEVGSPGDVAAVADLSDGLPSDPETALSMVLLVTLCESLALYRSEIEELVARIERAGIDPLSTFDHLKNDPDVELALDVERRRHQLVQLLQ